MYEFLLKTGFVALTAAIAFVLSLLVTNTAMAQNSGIAPAPESIQID